MHHLSSLISQLNQLLEKDIRFSNMVRRYCSTVSNSSSFHALSFSSASIRSDCHKISLEFANSPSRDSYILTDYT